ncbi:MAG TPA: BrnA antitoxin family protein [Stellaceae bacterium]|nr:BrnA antitoxin family protein [Stellaceae bacterium]
MRTRKHTTKRKWIDPDDAPHLDREWFARGEIREGDRLIRRGRPKSAAPKEAVSLRLDPDVLQHFRATGPGWQSRINTALRKVAKLGS